jgi:hypothetical protein
VLGSQDMGGCFGAGRGLTVDGVGEASLSLGRVADVGEMSA